MSDTKGYVQKYVESHYHTVQLYISEEKEKRCIMEYAADYKKMSLRKYILDLLFNQEEPENLEIVKRLNRNSGKKQNVKYKLLVPIEKKKACWLWHMHVE